MVVHRDSTFSTLRWFLLGLLILLFCFVWSVFEAHHSALNVYYSVVLEFCPLKKIENQKKRESAKREFCSTK